MGAAESLPLVAAVARSLASPAALPPCPRSCVSGGPGRRIGPREDAVRPAASGPPQGKDRRHRPLIGRSPSGGEDCRLAIIGRDPPRRRRCPFGRRRRGSTIAPPGEERKDGRGGGANPKSRPVRSACGRLDRFSPRSFALGPPPIIAAALRKGAAGTAGAASGGGGRWLWSPSFARRRDPARGFTVRARAAAFLLLSVCGGAAPPLPCSDRRRPCGPALSRLPPRSRPPSPTPPPPRPPPGSQKHTP